MSEEVLGGAVDTSCTSARPCFFALGEFISMATASFSAGFSLRCTLACNETGPVLFPAGPQNSRWRVGMVAGTGLLKDRQELTGRKVGQRSFLAWK